MENACISKIIAREILDSRGNPTVEATVILCDGTTGVASVPSGASTGIYEAHELRDRESKRYGGRGVMSAVHNINKLISYELKGVSVYEQKYIDDIMCRLDATANKSHLGANAVLAVSLACARAGANSLHMPFFRYIGGISGSKIPTPMMNILNGGAHATNNIDIQEFMIVPIGVHSFGEALCICSEIYHTLGKILVDLSLSTSVGDEGGYAPNLSGDEEAIQLICEAIEKSGYGTDTIKIAIDAASSEWHDNGVYKLPKRKIVMSREELTAYWEKLICEYPIFSIEDGLDQSDFDGWSTMTKKIGKKVKLVGDDLFVTNAERLRNGITKAAGNSILIKPNQIGSLSETLEVVDLAKKSGYSFVVSHRSGETEDTAIADISVGVNAPFIKSGAPCKGERIAKYNRLLKIESEFAGMGMHESV